MTLTLELINDPTADPKPGLAREILKFILRNISEVEREKLGWLENLARPRNERSQLAVEGVLRKYPKTAEWLDEQIREMQENSEALSKEARNYWEEAKVKVAEKQAREAKEVKVDKLSDAHTQDSAVEEF